MLISLNIVNSAKDNQSCHIYAIVYVYAYVYVNMLMLFMLITHNIINSLYFIKIVTTAYMEIWDNFRR